MSMYIFVLLRWYFQTYIRLSDVLNVKSTRPPSKIYIVSPGSKIPSHRGRAMSSVPAIVQVLLLYHFTECCVFVSRCHIVRVLITTESSYYESHQPCTLSMYWPWSSAAQCCCCCCCLQDIIRLHVIHDVPCWSILLSLTLHGITVSFQVTITVRAERTTYELSKHVFGSILLSTTSRSGGALSLHYWTILSTWKPSTHRSHADPTRRNRTDLKRAA